MNKTLQGNAPAVLLSTTKNRLGALMIQTVPMKIIARIHTDFTDKFGIPRQSGLVDGLLGTIVFEKPYGNIDSLRGLEDFSHIWLIWQFSKSTRETWSPTVRPPRLGGNARMGVFATRSPFRPNAIGLSSVKLDRIEMHRELGPLIHVRGADLMDQTPIFDIKPYLPYADAHCNALGGFAPQAQENLLQVEIPSHLLPCFPPQRLDALVGVIAHDPRPSYQDDPQRIYGMDFAGYTVRFQVSNQIATVCLIEKHM